MALATVEDVTPPKPQRKEPEPTPDVLVTPCDPWPRPYYLEGGLRRVAPYHFTYNTYCKQRWRGKQILDIFSTEFRDRTPEYYKNAIETGGVTVNGKAVPTDHVIKNGDVVSHTLHRHEPPVTGLPIGVLHEDNDMIVIDKPAGVPVHPAGRYNYNSVIEIMRAERGHTWNPLPCNRLDRLTSGVMFIGKNPKAAEEIGEKLRGRTVQKEYVACVKGRFPDGIIVCDQPILQISPILGLNRARESGKDAKTKFRRLAFFPPQNRQKPNGAEGNETTTNGGSSVAPATPPPPPMEEEGYSIVHCLPLTGRTHQIRVHLQFLGHPITNDPIYSNRRVFGPDLARHDATGEHDDAIIARLSRVGKSETAETLSYTSFQTLPSVPKNADPKRVEAMIAVQHEEMIKDYQKRKGEKMSGERCDVCNTELYSDPGVHELGIFLHAVAYADNEGKWKYRSKMPSWALPPAGEDGPREVPDWLEEGQKSILVGTTDGGNDTALVEGVGPVDIREASQTNGGEVAAGGIA